MNCAGRGRLPTCVVSIRFAMASSLICRKRCAALLERSRILRLGSTERYQELRTSGKATELRRSTASHRRTTAGHPMGSGPRSLSDLILVRNRQRQLVIIDVGGGPHTISFGRDVQWAGAASRVSDLGFRVARTLMH